MHRVSTHPHDEQCYASIRMFMCVCVCICECVRVLLARARQPAFARLVDAHNGRYIERAIALSLSRGRFSIAPRHSRCKTLSNSFTAVADGAFAIVGNLHCRSTRTFACCELKRESRCLFVRTCARMLFVPSSILRVYFIWDCLRIVSFDCVQFKIV